MSTVTCPKCAYTRQASDSAEPDWSCPSCGLVYAKFDADKDRANQAKLESLRAQAAARQLAAELTALRQTVVAAKNWADLPRDLQPAKARNIQDALNQRAATQSPIPHHLACAMMFVVTTPTVPGHEIDMTLDIVSSECAYGMNLFKDFFAGITDVVGGRSGSTQSVLADARQKVLDEMRTQAYAIGADAIVGIRFDFNEFSGAGKSMLFVAGTGTAVKLR